jgi:hypothetical protein
MAAVMQEPQDDGTPTPLRDNVPWRSKVDDRGNTHLYKRVTAKELKVGDHLLEHIAGHKRQVATPILGIQHVADGVIVTIPDRHSNNAPVDELYAFNKPLVISRTPHLEQHDPNQNIFFQLERKEPNMEQNTLEKARDGIQSAQMRINNAVENLILTVNPGLAAEAAQHVQAGATDLSNSIILGADAVAEAYVKDAADFGRWNVLITNSAEFTQARSARLGNYERAVSNVDLQRSASYARGALDTATQVALEQRKRGIVASMNGPLAEYAIEDARNLGMLSQPEREEAGVLLAKVPPEAVLARGDGSMVAVPVPTPALRRMDVGAPVDLIADEVGVYVRNEAMEKKVENRLVQQQEKQQYPKMEGHMQTKEGTWHSVSLYMDKEGQPRGSVAVENRAQGLAERFLPKFEERVSEKTGEKFLTAKMDRADGKTLYVNLMPHEKAGDRWLSSSFAERDPAKEKGQQLTGIEGKGGDMKPNQALLDKANKDRTATYLRETLKIDPVKVHERDQARKGLQPAKGVQI